MRKFMAALLTLALICSSLPLSLALAGDDIWIVCNPNPSDRLNLRVGMDENEYSLGKYYNGTKVTVLDRSDDPWFKVRVGGIPGNQVGYMHCRYLSGAVSSDFVNRMPMYVSTKQFTAYHQPSKTSETEKFGKFLRVYVMGVSDEGWWHVLVRLKEGDYSCFVPANLSALTPVTTANVSNPDKADRLHLRTSPDRNAQSLGKYYNGASGTVLGQSMDLEWSYVDVYGRTGFMLSKYLCFEGEYNYTYYGLVQTKTTSDTSLVRTPDSGAQKLSKLSAGDALTVYGVLDDWLHVEAGGTMGFVKRSLTDYVDTKYQ